MLLWLVLFRDRDRWFNTITGRRTVYITIDLMLGNIHRVNSVATYFISTSGHSIYIQTDTESVDSIFNIGSHIQNTHICALLMNWLNVLFGCCTFCLLFVSLANKFHRPSPFLRRHTATFIVLFFLLQLLFIHIK